MKTLRVLFALLFAVTISHNAMAWGVWGHHITAYIAEQHLNPEEKEKCEYYLQHSLPHYSVWQDQWRRSDPFKETTFWHMNYVDKDYNTVGRGGNISRDAVTQLVRINKEMSKGNYRNMPDSVVAMNLKFIIHMVGDMHCPCHLAHAKESGFKGTSLYVNGKKYNRHKFWDAAPQLLHPKWKLERFAKAYDTYSAKEIKKICKGVPAKWSVQNAVKMEKSYGFWQKGDELKKLSKEQRQDIEDLTHEQLAYGG